MCVDGTAASSVMESASCTFSDGGVSTACIFLISEFGIASELSGENEELKVDAWISSFTHDGELQLDADGDWDLTPCKLSPTKITNRTYHGNSLYIELQAGVGNFHLNPRFHRTGIGGNLG